MNKLIKATIACCVSGAALICGGSGCLAEETDGSSKTASIMDMISDTVSTIAQDEKLSQVIQEIVNSQEVQKVAEYSAEVWNKLPEEEREGISSYVSGLLADKFGICDEFGIHDESPLSEERSAETEDADRVQILTAEEAAAHNFVVYPVEGMTVGEYTLEEDPVSGYVYTVTMSTGDTYYVLTMKGTDADAISDMENDISAMSMIDPDNVSAADVKVGDFDAQVNMIPSMGYCTVNWIDTENDQYYSLTGIVLGDGLVNDMNPESMGELAAALTQAEH